MVEAFSADRADQPFDVRALPGRSESGENLADVQAFDQRPECGAVDAVAVPEQEPRRLVPREGLHNLGCGPLGGGMLGDIEMNDAPPIMSQNKKNVQDPESNGGHHEEVHGHQLINVIFEERPPAMFAPWSERQPWRMKGSKTQRQAPIGGGWILDSTLSVPPVPTSG